MRLLFITIVPPIPTTSGQRIRNKGLLDALAKAGHHVTLLSFEDLESSGKSANLAGICEDAQFIELPATENAAIGRMKALFSFWPYGARRLRSRAMQRLFRQLIAGGVYEAVICDDVYAFINVASVHSSVPLVLNKHDITHEIIARFIKNERNPVKRLYGMIEYKKVRRLERVACSKADLVLTCSARDLDLINQDSPDANLAIVPNVIETDHYCPSPHGEPGRVLFTGAMDWMPNRDAVDFFVSKILPIVLRSVPDARFVIAGRGAPPRWQRRFDRVSHVSFTGPVQRMQEELARASLCVVPLRIGSGTRLKILEAAAMAKPVVSTRIGAEGLSFVDGREIILADSPEQFAKATINLLTDEVCRNRIGSAARLRVEAEYGLGALQRSLERAISLVPRRDVRSMPCSLV